MLSKSNLTKERKVCQKLPGYPIHPTSHSRIPTKVKLWKVGKSAYTRRDPAFIMTDTSVWENDRDRQKVWERKRIRPAKLHDDKSSSVMAGSKSPILSGSKKPGPARWRSTSMQRRQYFFALHFKKESKCSTERCRWPAQNVSRKKNKTSQSPPGWLMVQAQS